MQFVSCCGSERKKGEPSIRAVSFHSAEIRKQVAMKYEAYPESKYTNILNMYSAFNLQKRHCQ